MSFFKQNKKLIFIILIAWLLIFGVYAVYKIKNAPVVCWDSMHFNEEPDELQPMGGCEPTYYQTVNEMTIPTIIWIVLLIIVLGVLKYRNQ